MEETANDFISHFSIIRDPRIDRTKRHPLNTIVFTAVCAVIAGAEHWTEVGCMTVVAGSGNGVNPTSPVSKVSLL